MKASSMWFVVASFILMVNPQAREWLSEVLLLPPNRLIWVAHEHARKDLTLVIKQKHARENNYFSLLSLDTHVTAFVTYVNNECAAKKCRENGV